ncbi:phage holin family protein [Actinomadura parmotrematis]|uniref:Phage holin family protein n=1 Tax=Actinomadura parmotrematis TaxID=2864039 RepID=A0ABS7FNU7_9ACTN|nr:phage holin family protein [Actinomadura parmotrematis]MBW8482032.1 phage holin family protein [Actinomadura parmotrematis]
MTDRQGTDLAGVPTADLIKSLSERSAELVREELQLAQLELKTKATRAGKAAGILGGAGLVALYGGGALVATLILALAAALPGWAAALIVTVVLFAVAGVLALVGKKRMAAAAPPKPEQAVESVREDVQEIKSRGHR